MIYAATVVLEFAGNRPTDLVLHSVPLLVAASSRSAGMDCALSAWVLQPSRTSRSSLPSFREARDEDFGAVSSLQLFEIFSADLASRPLAVRAGPSTSSRRFG